LTEETSRKEKFDNYSDDELIKIAYIQSEEYEPTTVSIAKEILSSRNVSIKDAIEYVKNTANTQSLIITEAGEETNRLNRTIIYIIGFALLVILFKILPFGSNSVSISNELRSPTIDDPAGYVFVDSVCFLRFPENPFADTTIYEIENESIKYISHKYTDKDLGITYGFSYYHLPQSQMNTSHDILLDNARDGGLSGSSSSLIEEVIVTKGKSVGRRVFGRASNGLMTIVTDTYIINNQLYIIMAVAPSGLISHESITDFFDAFTILDTEDISALK
jgi:hypothetical protein